MAHKPGCRIGFDIGGTFTDFVLLEPDTGRLHTHKALTTTHDPAAGSIAGLEALVAKAGKSFADVADIVHGTTIVTNAVIERRGARTALLTTRGFRDILEMGTEQRYDAHDLFIRFPEPLVDRSMRFEVDERIAADGSVVSAISAEEVRRLVASAVAAGAGAIAVSFLHAYKNDAHEQLVARIIADEFPGIPFSLSSEVCAEVREYERTTTTTANAYVMPLIDPYVRSIEEALKQRGFAGALYLMQSSGQLASPEMARRFPVRLLESGPAGGAIAAGYFGSIAGHNDVIAFDMGGTTAKVCLIEDGRADVAPMIEAAREHRFKRGSGLPIRAPVIDMIEIGAGGGSIAYFDELGLMKVGPRSAGSTPGPACYGRGGELPTVTDANLVLGRLVADNFLGGRMSLDAEASARVIGELAAKLGRSPEETAEGALTVLNSNMANAIRSRTVQKGIDPREFTLAGFGGAGPLHAAEVAAMLDMQDVLIPPHPGITSAVGLLTADLEYHALRTAFAIKGALDLGRLQALFDDMEAELGAIFARDKVPAEKVKMLRQADLRYVGQGYELKIDVPDGPLTDAALESVWSAFHDRHREEYGHAFEASPIEIVTVKVRGVGIVDKLAEPPAYAVTGEPKQVGSGRCVFRVNDELKTYDTPHIERTSLPVDRRFSGPAILLQTDTTTVVPPGWTYSADHHGNVRMTRDNKA